jgi:hypothetical protein
LLLFFLIPSFVLKFFFTYQNSLFSPVSNLHFFISCQLSLFLLHFFQKASLHIIFIVHMQSFSYPFKLVLSKKKISIIFTPSLFSYITSFFSYYDFLPKIYTAFFPCHEKISLSNFFWLSCLKFYFLFSLRRLYSLICTLNLLFCLHFNSFNVK